MRISFIIYLIFIVSACNSNKPEIRSSNKASLSNEILKKTAIKLKQENDLYPFGSGGGMMNEIRMLALSFVYRKPIDIAKGRELLVAATKELADAVNADLRIHQYLKNYPFGPENIEIAIYIHKSDDSQVDLGDLHVISMDHGILHFYIDNPNGKLFKTIHQETFEEALAILDGKAVPKTFEETVAQEPNPTSTRIGILLSN